MSELSGVTICVVLIVVGVVVVVVVVVVIIVVVVCVGMDILFVTRSDMVSEILFHLASRAGCLVCVVCVISGMRAFQNIGDCISNCVNRNGWKSLLKEMYEYDFELLSRELGHGG